MNTFLFTTMKPIAPLLIVILVPTLIVGIPFFLSIKKQWKSDRPKAVGRVKNFVTYLLGLILGYALCLTRSEDVILPAPYTLIKDFSMPVSEKFSGLEKTIEEAVRHTIDIANRSLATGDDSLKLYDQYFTAEPLISSVSNALSPQKNSIPDDKSAFFFDLQKANQLLAKEKETPIQLRYLNAPRPGFYRTTRKGNEASWIDHWIVFLAVENAKCHQAVLFFRLEVSVDKDPTIHVGILPGCISFVSFSDL